MRALATLGLILSCAAAAATTPVAPMRTRAGSDWPTFLGPRGDGTSSETGIRTDWTRGLPIAWQTDVGEGYAMGSVAGGRLYLFDHVGGEARLTARGARTGAVLWTTKWPSRYEDLYGYSAGPRASPVVDGDRVYTFGVSCSSAPIRRASSR